MNLNRTTIIKAIAGSFLMGCLAGACSEEHPPAPPSSASSATVRDTVAAPAKSTEECFLHATPQMDTFRLRVITNGNKVTGTLSYAFAEKDRNSGNIEGTLSGDVLIADYTFVSEGMTSVRQVAFKKAADAWIEGHAAMEEKNNRQVFVSTDSIDFTPVTVFKRTNCPD